MLTDASLPFFIYSKKKNRNGLQNFECLAFVGGTGYNVVDTTWGPVRIGVYARHLSKWLRQFPLAQMHFVSGERLIADPASEMAKVQVSFVLLLRNMFFFLSE